MLTKRISFVTKTYGFSIHSGLVKSLSYFEDADKDEDPIMLTSDNWNDIRLFIKDKVEKHTAI